MASTVSVVVRSMARPSLAQALTALAGQDYPEPAVAAAGRARVRLQSSDGASPPMPLYFPGDGHDLYRLNESATMAQNATPSTRNRAG